MSEQTENVRTVAAALDDMRHVFAQLADVTQPLPACEPSLPVKVVGMFLVAIMLFILFFA
jgi:hypothetical protein